MKFKVMTYGGVLSMLLVVGLALSMLQGCGTQIYEYQLDALDLAVDTMEQEVTGLLDHDPKYKDFTPEEIKVSQDKRKAVFKQTKVLLKTIRTGEKP